MMEFVQSVAREAGALLLDYFGGLGSGDIAYKDIKDPVTAADRASQALIIERLQDRFPGDRIVAEEEGGVLGEGEAVWYIDPLDGTTNFVHGFPFFSVSIARVRGERIELGVVYNPVSDDLFAAESGGGAFRNGEPMSVSDVSDPLRALVATGFACVRSNRVPDTVPFFDGIVREVQGIRRPGSAALDLAFTASGVFDGFWELNLNRWDLAAGLLLVQEAGGKMSDFAGGNEIFSRREVIAGNPAIHAYLAGRIETIAGELGWDLA